MNPLYVILGIFAFAIIYLFTSKSGTAASINTFDSPAAPVNVSRRSDNSNLSTSGGRTNSPNTYNSPAVPPVETAPERTTTIMPPASASRRDSGAVSTSLTGYRI